MLGFGLAPFGAAPFGIGAPSVAPTRTPNVVVPYDVSPRLDPATKQIVTVDGTPAVADGVEQRVLIRLSMDKGSSAVRLLGNELKSIKRITDNHVKRVDTTIRAAVADMVNSREIEIVAITVERFGATGTYAKLEWRKTGEIVTRTTELG